MSDEISRHHFGNIARVVKMFRINKAYGEKRKPMSQSQLSEIMGYRNGQFISNVERGLCSVPLYKLKVLCEALNIPEEAIQEAMVADFRDDIKHSLQSRGLDGVQINTAPESTGVGASFN